MNNFNENSPEYLHAKSKVRSIKGFYIHALVYVVVNVFLIYQNAVVENHGFGDIRNYYTALFWGCGLLTHGLTVFMPNFIFGKDWEQKKSRN